MPSPSTPAPTPRGPNNRRIAERLGRYRRLLDAVNADAEAAALVARRGYPAERLAEGLALCAAAEEAYATRDTATGDRTAAAATLRSADADVRERYAEVRTTLRTLYPDAADRARLGVAASHAPQDRDELLTVARATLAAVRQAPYAAEAARHGLDTATLDGLDDALTTLATTAQAHIRARGSATAATDSRQDAYGTLQTFMTRFRRFAKLAFKDHLDVATRIGF